MLYDKMLGLTLGKVLLHRSPGLKNEDHGAMRTRASHKHTYLFYFFFFFKDTALSFNNAATNVDLIFLHKSIEHLGLPMKLLILISVFFIFYEGIFIPPSGDLVTLFISF